LLGGGLAVAGVLRAQEPRVDEESRATTESTQSPQGAETARDEAVKQPAATESDASDTAPPPRGSSPSRFEPTEKVRADFDVSFPIDI
jgi:hypothetical protein